jgi:hypothetical protein
MLKTYPENHGLGLWVKEQRRKYSKQKAVGKSSIERERFRQLNAIGFCWAVVGKMNISPFYGDRWEKRFKELLQYKMKVCLLQLAVLLV